jgi:hypothetical protein
MQVTKIQETTFGTSIEGVRIELTLSEAAQVAKILSAGMFNPPKDQSGNIDYASRDLAGRITKQITAAVRT